VILGVSILAIFVLSAATAHAFSIKQEIDLGKTSSQEVEKEMPLSKNKKWQDDIAAMGKRFIPFLKRKEIPYHFAIVTDKEDTINAFSLPGGYVYFTEHMWKILTPDERAAVMAHEIEHSDQRHAVDEMLKSQQRMLWTLPLVVLSGGVAGVGEAAMWGNILVDARYSRKMERQADELGIDLDRRAGFNPAGMVTAMKKLLSIETDINRYEVSSIFMDHPDTLKRVEYLTQAAIAMGVKPEDLELKKVEDPSRLGNITKKSVDLDVMYARLAEPVSYGDRLAIKKMLWDDDKQALAPKTVAIATVLTPGRFPALVLASHIDYNFSDVMIGDGVYPAPPPAPVAPFTPQPPAGEKKTVKF